MDGTSRMIHQEASHTVVDFLCFHQSSPQLWVNWLVSVSNMKFVDSDLHACDPFLYQGELRKQKLNEFKLYNYISQTYRIQTLFLSVLQLTVSPAYGFITTPCPISLTSPRLKSLEKKLFIAAFIQSYRAFNPAGGINYVAICDIPKWTTNHFCICENSIWALMKLSVLSH